MDYSCPKCRNESGVKSVLIKDKKTGLLGCKINSRHKFIADKTGYLKTLTRVYGAKPISQDDGSPVV